MAGLFEKNPKRKTANNKYTPKKLAEEEIIKGQLVDVGNDEQILSTQLIINEEQVGDKKTPVIAALIDSKGKVIKDLEKIEEFKNKIKGSNLYTIDNPEKIGKLTREGELKVSNRYNLQDEKIIIDKNSELVEILFQKNGKELVKDRYGEIFRSDYLSEHVSANIQKKGVENLQKQPTRSAMKGAREEAKEIGKNLKQVLSQEEQENPNLKITRKMAQGIKKIKDGHSR